MPDSKFKQYFYMTSNVVVVVITLSPISTFVTPVEHILDCRLLGCSLLGLQAVTYQKFTYQAINNLTVNYSTFSYQDVTLTVAYQVATYQAVGNQAFVFYAVASQAFAEKGVTQAFYKGLDLCQFRKSSRRSGD